MTDPRKLTETEMLEMIAALESELAEAKRKWRGPIEGGERSELEK